LYISGSDLTSPILKISWLLDSFLLCRSPDANYKFAYGGGVNWIKINNLTVTRNSAVANVYVSKYLEVKVPKGYAKTQGTGNDIFSFSRDNGQWKISDLGGPGPIGNNVTTITPSP
jgi:hypothetical protein